MRILIVRLSSMGDLIQTFPMVRDIKNHVPNAQIDWLVDENFQQIVQWHPDVNHIIPVALRRWKKNLFTTQTWKEFTQCFKKLRNYNYDIVIDVQGLIKSAVIARLTKSKRRVGYDTASAREAQASWFYHQYFNINQQLAVMTRMRQLAANALNYTITDQLADYGITTQQFNILSASSNYVLLLHSTTWPNKHWPNEYWQKLAQLITAQGFTVKLPWWQAEEKTRAEMIVNQNPNIEILPRLTLDELIPYLIQAHAIISIDTGLGHLAAALQLPTIMLWGPTDPHKVATAARKQLNIQSHFPCSPCLKRSCSYQKPSRIKPACFEELTPELVWEQAQRVIQNVNR